MAQAESLLERVFSGTVDGPEELDAISRQVLDAAFEEFCRAGIQRTTMEDVARRAGVSRITVYRRFATKDALVEQLVRRELRRYAEQFQADIAPARDVAERVVLGFASSLRTLRRNPLIGGLIAADPTMAPSLVGDGGRVLATLCNFVAGQLRREQRAGHVASDLDVDLVAEMIVRICGSFLVIPSPGVDVDDEQQLQAIARKFLVPMLHSGG